MVLHTLGAVLTKYLNIMKQVRNEIIEAIAAGNTTKQQKDNTLTYAIGVICVVILIAVMA